MVPASAQEVDETAIALTMWVTADGVQKTTMEGVAESYRETHPNFTLQVEEFPFLDMHDKLRIALESGTGAPDVAWVEISRFGLFLKGDIGLVDITERLAPYEDLLIPSRQAFYTYQGKVYGIEGCACPVELYYRDDILSEAGISTPIATWEDYVAAGKALQEATGKHMIALETTDWDAWTPIMLQFGGGFFDEAGNVILDNEANQKAFDFYVGLVHEHGIAIPAPGGDQYNPSFWGAYSAGDVATIWGADWMNSVIKGFAPDLSGKWRAQPLPTSADAAIPTASVGGTAMVLTEQSQVPDAAFDFMVYTMLQREPTSNAALPGNREFWEHPVVIAPDEYFGGQEIGRLFIEQAELLLEPGAPFLIPNPNNPTAYDIFTRTALGPAVNGEKTAAQALADAAAELRATIEG